MKITKKLISVASIACLLGLPLQVNAATNVKVKASVNKVTVVKAAPAAKAKTKVAVTKLKTLVIKVVTVNNAKEFLNAIGSNTKIILKPGDYNLTKASSSITNNKISLRQVFDGNEVIINGISNLTITSEGNTLPQILVQPRYAFVLTFRNSSNITIDGVIAGHTIQEGTCVGGVLAFDKCNDVAINNSQLFGCGTEGVNLFNTNNFTFSNSQIRECTYDIMTISKSKNIKFINSKFNDNKEFDMINVYDNSDVVIDSCKIIFNHADNNEFSNYSLFNPDSTSTITVKNSKVSDNMIGNIQKPNANVKLQNNVVENNTLWKK